MEKSDVKQIRAYASRLFKNQIDYLKNQIAGVKYDNDIEFVHQTRVSTRRIRNLLAVFSPYIGKKNAAKWIPAIRFLTKSLTKVRDLDVQILFLEKNYSHKLENKYKQGIDRLKLRKSQNREKIQPQILNGIEKFNQTRVMEEMEQFIKLYFIPKDEFTPPDVLYQVAINSIDNHIKNTFTFVPFITDPTNVEDLHNMRIAIKNLRYTTEIFSDMYPDISNYIETLKSLQDYLGTIHDYDVWVEDLEKFRQKERIKILQFYGKTTPFNFIQPGITFLQEDIQRSRNDLYIDFLNYWNNIYQQLFWSNFRDDLKYYPHPTSGLNIITEDLPQVEEPDETLDSVSEDQETTLKKNNTN